MTIFHILGYWMLALVVVLALLLSTYYICGIFGKEVWRRLTRTYDLYTVHWVMQRVEQLGHEFPRYKIPEEYHKELKGGLNE